MSPEDVVRALVRRWYVLLVALAVTAAGAYHELKPPLVYRSSAVVVLKPPVTGNQPNQFANLQPPLAVVSHAVVEQLQSASGAEELRAAGVIGAYRLLPRNSGTSVTPAYLIPSLQVQADQPDPAAADRAVRRIIAVYTRHVGQLQDSQNIDAASRMSVDVLVPPNPVQVTGTKSRALAGVALAGLGGGTLCALWTDRWLLRRRVARTGLLPRGPDRTAPAGAVLPAPR
ncbi:hypothetical protein SAMN05216267_1016146 [Actinacidiphila rubida]|uniref:Capsular polysaccharide biosynthesis protein n=1 Tax=Actinacidiphila rubida TaxID=310780 RepID=A0A1H8LPX5_9ACTN|nr:hypothetical protein [Actinacidiphila rubida]SEO07169.1 hypothetical protein SAMN05216267_1016146 [Actinacidiphila rubida]